MNWWTEGADRAQLDGVGWWKFVSVMMAIVVAVLVLNESGVIG